MTECAKEIGKPDLNQIPVKLDFESVAGENDRKDDTEHEEGNEDKDNVDDMGEANSDRVGAELDEQCGEEGTSDEKGDDDVKEPAEDAPEWFKQFEMMTTSRIGEITNITASMAKTVAHEGQHRGVARTRPG